MHKQGAVKEQLFAWTNSSYSLFATSALLMTLATSTLIWLYGFVNGKDVKKTGTGNAAKKMRTGNVKGE